MLVFTFKNLAPGGGITCVSASDEEQAWGILKKNSYQDCDVSTRYELDDQVPHEQG
jgi:hypothetical protein